MIPGPVAAPSSGDRLAAVGWIAVGFGFAATIWIGLVRGAATDEIGPGLSAESIVAFAVLIAGPAMVGTVGMATRRREVLVGAGLAYLPLAVLSFSGVTLVLLIPAVLFLYAGTRPSVPRAGLASRHVRPVVALAIAGVLTLGLIGLLATTTAVCWEETSDGSIRVREVPAAELSSGVEVAIGADDVVVSGCSSGVVSMVGALVVSICVVAAIGVAARSGRSGA